MRRMTYGAITALVFAGAVFAMLSFWPIGNKVELTSLKGVPERGAYLARTAGCIACHSNFKEGGAPLAGGVAFKTQFGIFYSPNITTDTKHGMGEWSLADFERAVRQGVSPDGEAYYPAFPYPFYAKLSDQDVADLWAAFQTVAPVAQASKPHEVPFPFNVREGLKVWRGLFLDQQADVSVSNKSEQWQRGQYLVEGPGHCGACHTPRNLLGARKADLALQGADKLPDGSKSPSITAEALRKGGWDKDNLAYAFQTGLMPDGDVFGGSMGEVVRDGMAFLSLEDREAIAIYLLDLKE